MKSWMIALLVGCGLAANVCAQEVAASPDPYANETKEQKDARMAWWREARFGMFIHWGVYAVPAGTYNGKEIGGIGEWIMNRGKIPVAEYKAFAPQFTAAKYDPDAWVAVAKKAGMRYIVITSKHHDGFALFDSKASTWDAVDAAGAKRDLIAPLAAAARKQGLKFGLYYSQAQDWTHPGGAKSGYKEGESWDEANKGSFDQYLRTIAEPQVKEILTQIKPDVLWWDTPTWMNKERAELFLPHLKLVPGIIHNNRLGGGYRGDTETPEQHIPATGFKDRDWETCMTMNGTWGFKSYDHAWKPTQVLLRNLIDIASKGGNYLLNVGPNAEGEIPQPSIERLLEVGKWMDVNGKAIYGTSASPFTKLAWGRCTKKATEAGGTLFLHVFDWPADGKLVVPGLKSKVTGASLLADGAKLEVEQGADAVTVKVPATASDTNATVIALEFTGALDVAKTLPGPDAKGIIELSATTADIHNHLGSEAKLENDHIGFWISEKVTVSWTCKVAKDGDYAVRADAATTKDSKFTVSSGPAKFEAAVENTQGYDKYRKFTLGTIALKAGEQTITLAPQTGKWSPLNLRGLTLAPVQ